MTSVHVQGSAAAPEQPAGQARRPARAHQEVWIPVRAASVEQAVAAIRAAGPPRRWNTAIGTVRMHVRHDGRVRAARTSGRYTSYPTFRGRLVADEAGRVRLHGLVRESMNDLVWIGAFLAVTVMMGAFTVGLLVSAVRTGDWVWPGLGVCGVSTVVFALICKGLGRSRRTFPQEARRLVALMAQQLPR